MMSRSFLRPGPWRLAWLPAILFALSASLGEAAENDVLGEARRLWLRGRYDEASEQYELAAATDPTGAALGQARCLIARGQYQRADAGLAAAIERQGPAPVLLGQRALLALRAGRHEAARESAAAALAADAQQPAARWVLAELARLAGKVDEAAAAYSLMSDEASRGGGLPLEQLQPLAWAAAQHARWTGDSNRFQWLVRELYPAWLRRDPDFWPAHYESACLLLEKYNAADARTQLQAALAINPQAAEVHAALAARALQEFDLPAAEASIGRALAIDGDLLAAHRLHADRLLAELRFGEAIEALAPAVALNPGDEETLGRLAAAYGLVGGGDEAGGVGRRDALIAQVTARNPRCGVFYVALGDSLDLARRYPQAAEAYRQAIQRLPQRMYARGKLGLMLMRLGEELEARQVLEQAFAEDPFNVRVKNMLEVLDVLRGYTTLESDHFIIRFDPAKDDVLASCARDYLEREVYPEIVATLGFEPAGKSLIEFFCNARQSSGHAWFSARMIGLPFIGTVGACAGRVVAVASPTDMPQKFNWARVLRHEFVHVVNLQQTDFAIPHWYTEALAVRLEGSRRPDEWIQVLAERGRAGQLLDLQTIDRAFIRPRDHDQWTLAYCQAELYAEFIDQRFGQQALSAMLEAYAGRLSTEQAIARCFGLDLPQFEKQYREFLEPLIEAGAAGPAAERLSFAELLRAVEDDPRDADRWAELAEVYLRRGDPLQARRCATAASEIQPAHQLAAYVLARLYLTVGDAPQALRTLESAVREDAPHENALALLAGLHVQAGESEEAERLCRLGLAHFPRKVEWLKSLSRIYLKSGEQHKLMATLAELAEYEPDSLPIRKKLIELCLAAGRPGEAAVWARGGLQIDALDAELHACLGQALADSQQSCEAVDAFRLALRLRPERLEWYLPCAEACVAAGRPEDALGVLEGLLLRDPDHDRGRQMHRRLKQEGPAAPPAKP